ncbi:MAG: ORF6N domain-containing protein [Bacilli bacterium]|nr:ORF6N domain-containing protein [Bacilli bacterium]
MNELAFNEELKIEDMIYEIRGQQVILDRDLSKLYKVMTGNLNKAVKRNIERFPERFMFQLTENEYKNLIFQIGISNQRGGTRKLPYAFTEQGVAMLSSVLHSEIAINTSIKIIDAFVAMRHYIGNNNYRLSNVESKIIEHDKNIRLLQESFNKLEKNKEINEIYFNGKIYDAYSKIINIFNSAKKELIIVDRYTDKTILDMIKNLKCNVVLITGKNNKLTKLDIEKYNQDYNNLKVYYDDTFHDRYFILDRNKIYHSGNSINHINYRKSSLNLLKDKSVKISILKDVDAILVK